jgi:hypothetical protein
MKFNTVNEVTIWREFTLGNTTYDLSHLNAKWVEYLDDRDIKNPVVYKFIVTYSFHCFAKDSGDLPGEELELLMYKTSKESRPFNIERYELSKQLPNIIGSLGSKEILVCHGGYGNFAAVKILDANGDEINYYVSFKVFREEKKLRLHVLSAYPLDQPLEKVKKVGFFVIAKNLLDGKKLPKP